MTIALPGLGVAFAAFYIWLAVRIVNRREKWAKWTAVGMAAVLVGYPVSFGPVCWLADQMHHESGDAIYQDACVIGALYRPAATLIELFPDSRLKWSTVVAYGEWGAQSGNSVSLMSVAFALQ